MKKTAPSRGLSDVEFIIETLGQPEAFVDESENEGPQQAAKETRRFFRNPDEKVMGGVCSGIGAYLISIQFGFEYCF
jgi:phage shock protein C